MEVAVVVPPPGDVGPGYCGDGSCAELKQRGNKQAFVGGSRNSFPLSFLTILFFGGKAPKTRV